MMPRRVGMMVGVWRGVRVRMVLHLAGPGRRRRALVVLRRHLAARARAAGCVSASARAHAAQVTRRRAPRDRASASCENRDFMFEVRLDFRKQLIHCACAEPFYGYVTNLLASALRVVRAAARGRQVTRCRRPTDYRVVRRRRRPLVAPLSSSSCIYFAYFETIFLPATKSQW